VGRQEAGCGSPVGRAPTAQPDISTVAVLRQRAVRLEYFTVGWNLAEAFVALAAGWFASSIALKGFGLDSLIETFSGLTLLWRFRQKRLQDEHAESRAVRLVGITFFALAAYVGYEASADLWHRRAPEFSLAGVVLATVSLVVMPILGLAKRRIARALRSPSLAADSLETLLCSYLSGTLLVGLGLNGLLGWWWADPIAALGMAAFMIREGIEVFQDHP
jgi:divalent metal cation (Fe/Co/Zn/Cd) transporter